MALQNQGRDKRAILVSQIQTHTKVERYAGILSYSRYLFDTFIAVLVFMLYRYTVIGGIPQDTPVL